MAIGEDEGEEPEAAQGTIRGCREVVQGRDSTPFRHHKGRGHQHLLQDPADAIHDASKVVQVRDDVRPPLRPPTQPVQENIVVRDVESLKEGKLTRRLQDLTGEGKGTEDKDTEMCYRGPKRGRLAQEGTEGGRRSSFHRLGSASPV